MALVTSPSDVFELRKDGHLLARLLGGEQMGEFIAYKQLQATAAGRDRGYFDLKCGELVHTPQAAQRGGARVRLPLRDGMLCRILVGKTSTGVKKQASSQDNVFCLSYVEKTSHYNATVVDPLGLYKMSNRLLHDPTLRSAPTNSKSGHWATDEHLTWLNVGNDFAWVITLPFVTSPAYFIWKCHGGRGCNLCRGKEAKQFLKDGRHYNCHSCIGFRGNIKPRSSDFVQDYTLIDVFDQEDDEFNLMESRLVDFVVPTVVAAKGQMSRAVLPTLRCPGVKMIF